MVYVCILPFIFYYQYRILSSNSHYRNTHNCIQHHDYRKPV